jgi:hypothetical protein
MVGSSGPTDGQVEKHAQLSRRKALSEQYEQAMSQPIPDGEKKPALPEALKGLKAVEYKPLTDRMIVELDELQSKIDAPFEFGATAKSYIFDCWLKYMYQYSPPVVTKEMLKGLMTEQESLRKTSELFAHEGFRTNNKERFKNEFFTGEPDVIINSLSIVEDNKASWDLRTFTRAALDPIYFGQIQSYLDLKEFRNGTGRLIYCLNNTPDQLVRDEVKRVFWKFGEDLENKDFIKAEQRIEVAHNYDHIPLHEKVKVFEFGYDGEYMEELKKRVVLARGVMDTLTLVPPELSAAAIIASRNPL